MTRRIDFTGLVAVVTGAGHGLGRAYALELARRGAKVVVNDIAAEVDGAPGGGNPAQAVVDEIAATGGTACAALSDVAGADGGAAIVDRAVHEYGGLDILVNNAGIARTNLFRDVRYDDVLASLSVHLLGAFHTLLPAWRIFVDQGSGSVVNTTSAVGMFGQPRSSVYAAGKMGVVGLTRVLALEGAEHGIRVNAVAPVAQSRMAGDVYGALEPKLDPRLVASIVLALAHPSCRVTGEVLSAGGGRMSRILIGVAEGTFLQEMAVEDAAARLGEVAGSEELIDVPNCAMAEIDLIRRCYPELADNPMVRL